MYACIYSYMHAYMDLYACMCRCVYKSYRIHEEVVVNLRTFSLCICNCTSRCIYICMHTHRVGVIYICMHIRTCMQIYIHVCMYMQMCVFGIIFMKRQQQVQVLMHGYIYVFACICNYAVTSSMMLKLTYRPRLLFLLSWLGYQLQLMVYRPVLCSLFRSRYNDMFTFLCYYSCSVSAELLCICARQANTNIYICMHTHRVDVKFTDCMHAYIYVYPCIR
eukprot:TRINITY_DN2097_c0_g2_i2.p1 TRINITY_DN2097_c0_g2~~TRINITY_DN2097_c0_g2_i2.p1  ORF type:complete len:220 (+),score=-27.99 TRINITY_DN2097_c0_g2_i2:484-1143(+)